MDKYRSYLAVGIVAAVFMSSFFWGVPTSCVRLPNGLNIGKQALIDLSRPYFRPDIVPKFNNGKSLLLGDAWPFFATETTVYGTAEANNPNDDFRFVWQRDAGLIRKGEDPIRYERLIDEAGPLLEGTRYGGFGSEVIMRELQKQPDYTNQTCRTQWITW